VKFKADCCSLAALAKYRCLFSRSFPNHSRGASSLSLTNAPRVSRRGDFGKRIVSIPADFPFNRSRTLSQGPVEVFSRASWAPDYGKRWCGRAENCRSVGESFWPRRNRAELLSRGELGPAQPCASRFRRPTPNKATIELASDTFRFPIQSSGEDEAFDRERYQNRFESNRRGFAATTAGFTFLANGHRADINQRESKNGLTLRCGTSRTGHTQRFIRNS